MNIEAAGRVTDELKQSGYSALAVQVDVTQPESTRAMVAKTLQAFGRLDVLVCSAAMDPKFDNEHQGQHRNTFEDYPVDA